MSERHGNAAQGETQGPEQEPRSVGDADPAVRDPRPDGPMDQGGDAGRDEVGAPPPGDRSAETEEGSPT